jgi:hypothetical protein
MKLYDIILNHKKLLAWVFISVVAYFLFQQLIKSWKQIPFSEIKINYWWLFLSYIGLIMSFILSVLAWQQILLALSAQMSLLKSWWVITASFLAKYIPGHIWAVGGRMILCREEGISEKISGTGMIIEMMSLLLASLVACIIFIPFMINSGMPVWIYILLLFMPGVILTGLLFSPLMFKFLEWAAQRFKKKREVSIIIQRKRLFPILGLLILSCIIQGTAFFCLIRSIYPISFKLIPDVIGLYNGAWAVGFLSFITPGGLGAREGALAFLLKYYMPLPVGIIISIMARIWITIFEIMVALIGLKFKNTPSRNIK